jgi:hypothetical protein
MHTIKRSLPVLLWFGLSLSGLLVGCKEECEDVICAPCPSSRLVLEYQDSAGACLPGFHATAMVYAFDKDSPGDTVRSYNLADSCVARFIVQEDLFYHLVGAGVRDTIVIDSFSYQEPVEVTTCCLCYPVEHADIKINGVSKHVEWEVGKYDNTAVIRTF